MKYCFFTLLIVACISLRIFAQEDTFEGYRSFPPNPQDTLLNLAQELPTNDVWWQLFGDDTLNLLLK